MCGITGIFNVFGGPVPVDILKKMTNIISHRGPDAEGIWAEGAVGLGHRRLAVIDLTSSADQPMTNKDKSLVISYNGEIYNFKELRAELEKKGCGFISRSDTEVILRSYEEWGVDCVHKFNGMYAFAIWDRKKRKLFAARDRYGIKPFYYYFKNGLFVFGSEIKSMLQHPDVSKQISYFALNEYFTFQNIFSDLTLFENIKILPAASTLELKADNVNSLRINKYWDYNFTQDFSLTEQEYLEELNRLFEQAVTRQLVSDVEIGAYLSGGLDSGAITCVASKFFKNIKSFTCGFDLSSASGLELGFDERRKAEYLSNLYKTEHYEVVLKAGDMERIMPELIWHLEDLRVGQSYPNYYVSRLAGKFVKVALSGVGGDELFAGYPWRYYHAVNSDINEAAFVDNYYNYWQRLIPDEEKQTFFNPDCYARMSDHSTKDVFKSVIIDKITRAGSPEDIINLSLYFEIKTFLHGLLEVEDKLSMAHGLETRVPFLDNDLVDFAMRIPINLKLRDLGEVLRINENEPALKTLKYYEKTNDGKIILRKVLTQYVPQDYANGLKQGFSAPDASWFKGESIEYIKSLLFDPEARIYDYIQPGRSRQLLQEHFSGKINHRLLIWSLLCFEWWLRNFDPD